VLGTGGIGSAALWALARRGCDVLGLDRFGGAHDRGSSHGSTRVIRKAYFEHPDYVPLLHRAYELWGELQEAAGAPIWRTTGVVEIGPPDGEVIPGVHRAAREHGLPVQPLSGQEFSERFPHLRLPQGMEAVFEPDGGVLSVEACVEACLFAARAEGATVGAPAEGVRIEKTPGRWAVHTRETTHHARSLVVAAGAWTGSLLPELAPLLRVVRKPLLWYPPAPGVPEDAPVYLYETPGGVFYGFPPDAQGRNKVAEHTGGETVTDPLHVDRALRDTDVAPVARFLSHHLPGIDSNAAPEHVICLYTVSPDSHFLVGSPQAGLAVAAGLSGHGYKFAPVLGEALADLALTGESSLPLGAFSLGRF
jgi:sarcosine oxidase